MKENKSGQLKLQYTLTLEDILSFVKFQFSHSTKMKRILIIYRTLLPAVAGVVLTMAITGNFREGFTPTAGLIILTCFVLGFFFIPLTFKRSVEKATKKLYTEGRNKDLLGQHKTVLNDEGITDESRLSKAAYPWGVIQSALKTEEYVYFFISVESAIIIPIKNFKSSKKMESLQEYVSRKNG